MTTSHSLDRHYEELKRLFGLHPTPQHLTKCKELLSKLKIGLMEARLLPVGATHSPNVKDLTVVRDILEMGAFCSIRMKDVPSFDRYVSQLQTIYKDYSSVLPPSPREYPLLGLNLIRLLTQNRIADFHTTLESLRLPAEEAARNPFIKHPVNVERYLMEGSYSKVWNAREEAPAEEYKFFVDSLIGTIRNEIASCQEVAYESLPLKDAADLLFFKTRSELDMFARQRGWQIHLKEETITFTSKVEEKKELQKDKFIRRNLQYARELEQIV